MLHSTAHKLSTTSAVPLRLPPGTFLLRPEHADRAIGRSQLWTALRKEVLVFLFLAMLGAMMLLIGWQGIEPLLQSAQVQNTGALVQATVTRQRIAATGGRGQVSYLLAYRFTTGDGQTVDIEQTVSRPTFERYGQGDTVPVKYLPEQPERAALANGARDGSLDSGNVLVALTGGIGFVIVLAAMVFLGGYLWREEQFFTRGRLLMGHVLSCRARLETIADDLEVEVTDPPEAGRYMLTLSYTFRTPAGKTVKSSAQYQRNDLRGCPLPTFGQPVAVLYLDDKRHKVL
jgi:hypothetical protein